LRRLLARTKDDWCVWAAGVAAKDGVLHCLANRLNLKISFSRKLHRFW
jgi:hypothetical protein